MSIQEGSKGEIQVRWCRNVLTMGSIY